MPKRTATKRVGTSARCAVRLDDPLAERLRLAHHRLRVDRLVGRDEHEALGAELDRDLGDRPSSRARCSARTRAGSPPSAARACTRRRGRRRRAGSARRPGAASPRFPTSASTGTLGGEAALVDELALDLEQRRSRRGRRGSSRSAPTRAIWRQSSEPIEPPAPVTSTVSPREVGRRSTARSTSTGSRPSTSSTCDRADLAGEVEVAGDQLVDARAAS